MERSRRRLRPHPRSHRARHPRLRALQRADREGRLLPAERRARSTGNLTTTSGKAKFTVHPIPRNELEPGRYIMMTIRSHDQFNTHIYGLDDRYRGIYNGRRVIFMNAEDMKAAGLQQGAARRSNESFRRRGAVGPALSGRALPHPARLHRDLFSGSERARADQQRRRAIQYADEQVCDYLHRSVAGCGRCRPKTEPNGET